MRNLLQNLKSTGLNFNLWNSGLLDRIVSDYILNTKLKVVGVQRSQRAHRTNPRCKYYDQMPFKLLPNCASYKVANNKLSWLNGLFNLVSRTSRSSGVQVGWVNTHRNGFLKYMFNTLGHYRDTGKNIKYWKLGNKLMKLQAYQVSSFHYTVPDWHTNLSGSEVERLFQELNSIIDNQKVVINYRRVYIPKPNGKLRPLGVPTLAWRVYLHMLNNLIVWYKLGLEPAQHGYTPQRGVITCWSEVLTHLTESESVYEFDLKGFFDNVNLQHLEYELSLIGMPSEMIRHLGNLNRSIVKLTQTDLIDESAHRKVLYNSDGTLNPNLPLAVMKQLSSLTGSELSLKLQELLGEGYLNSRSAGVPQGAATSCGLSTLSLRQLYKEYKVFMYADDGVIFGSISEPHCTYDGAGIYKEPSKSRWVKQGGSFLNPLKFLGLEYIPAGIPSRDDETVESYPRLRSNTRSGTKLEFDSNLQFLCYLSLRYQALYNQIKQTIEKTQEENSDLDATNLLEQVELSLDPMLSLIDPNLSIETWIEDCYVEFQRLSYSSRLDLLFTSPAGPVTLSRMYNGSLDLLTVSDRSLTYSKRSWISVKWGSYLSRMSQTGYYRDLIDYLLENKVISLPECLKSVYENFPDKESLQPVHRSLFKQRSTSNTWIVAESNKTQFMRYRKFMKWYLKIVKLDLTNASTFACDDLLSYLQSNGSIVDWRYGPETLYCKAGFIKYQDPKAHKARFEEGKSRLLQVQRAKLKQELTQLHEDFIYNRNNPLSPFAQNPSK